MPDLGPEEKALAAAVSRTVAARDKLAAAEQELAHAVAACRAAGIADERIRRMTRKLHRADPQRAPDAPGRRPRS